MLARAVTRLPAAFTKQAKCERSAPRWLPAQTPTLFQCCQLRAVRIEGVQQTRLASSSSSTRWKARQSRDAFARSAKTAGLKSRAAFKLLEIDSKYRLFKPGDTVVDLGYAPGSWSQVAVNRTSPGGRVIGVDVIPVQPPRGVSTLQGDFLSPEIRQELGKFVQDPTRGRARTHQLLARHDEDGDGGTTEEQLELEGRGYLDLDKAMDSANDGVEVGDEQATSQRDLDGVEGRLVDVVLSDMSEPWPLASSTWIKSVSNPYLRMMNTSGIAFKDHAGSMDLCLAALEFCYDSLQTNGHFLCKFYQGSEDHNLEMKLKKLFEKVHRIKPDSSRKESKEAYFVGLRRRSDVPRDAIVGPG